MEPYRIFPLDAESSIWFGPDCRPGVTRVPTDGITTPVGDLHMVARQHPWMHDLQEMLNKFLTYEYIFAFFLYFGRSFATTVEIAHFITIKVSEL